jgi:hypothetical protein
MSRGHGPLARGHVLRQVSVWRERERERKRGAVNSPPMQADMPSGRCVCECVCACMRERDGPMLSRTALTQEAMSSGK